MLLLPPPPPHLDIFSVGGGGCLVHFAQGALNKEKMNIIVIMFKTVLLKIQNVFTDYKSNASSAIFTSDSAGTNNSK